MVRSAFFRETLWSVPQVLCRTFFNLDDRVRVMGFSYVGCAGFFTHLVKNSWGVEKGWKGWRGFHQFAQTKSGFKTFKTQGHLRSNLHFKGFLGHRISKLKIFWIPWFKSKKFIWFLPYNFVTVHGPCKMAQLWIYFPEISKFSKSFVFCW